MTGPVAYLLPIRRDEGPPPDELTSYLRWLSERTALTVVDGSPHEIFALDRAAWGSFAAHVPPDPDLRSLNGKAWGVRTGMMMAEHEIVVIADDDVRYDEASLAAAIGAIDGADLVRPQNYFSPLPWHAVWDTGRTLLNRAVGVDHPGTLVVRGSVYMAIGGYDGDVLFENLELVRTFQAAGARVVDRPDLYVRRLPPAGRSFWTQRVRQAYDDLAEPPRMLRHLAVIPFLLAARRRPRTLIFATAGVVALAEIGRRKAGGEEMFCASASLLSPIWLVERGVCSWIALGSRLLGGCSYSGSKLVRAATPVRKLRRRLGQP